MKKALVTAIAITMCTALCAGVWPQNGLSGKVPAEEQKADASAEYTKIQTAGNKSLAMPVPVGTATQTPEKGGAQEALKTPTVETALLIAESTLESITLALEPVSVPQATPATMADPYHTNVYPENVYSEKYLYDADGSLIGKAVTYPTEFGPDTVWIDGHAYYDVPGFGLVEWSGPNTRIEDYTMYESGVKVGIMGDEDKTPATTSKTTLAEEQPDPAGVVIDQTISTVPSRDSTPPDCNPDTTPPDDPNARNIG